MAGKKNWMERLQKHAGAVMWDQENVFNNVLRVPSPSVNFIFGKGWGLPLRYSMVLWGPQKGGKSILTRMLIGQLHEDDPDAVAVVYDTEARQRLQMSDVADFDRFGIDRKRYLAYETNEPEGIFDHIEGPLWAEIQDGLPVKLVVIDSTNDIRGRRGMNATSVTTQQIGDHAATMKDGLSRILKVQRRGGFSMVLTCHVAAEMDPIEQMRGNKIKMSAANFLKHYAEYFVMVEADPTKDGKEDLLGNKFEDESKKDMRDKAEKTAHKIRVCMKDSSAGPKGRMAEFTWHDKKGIINIHEEVFLLGINRGVIQRPNNLTYVFRDKQWSGRPAILKALEAEADLRRAILAELMAQDRDDVAGVKVSGKAAEKQG